MIDFIKKNKKNIINVLLALIVLVGISVLSLLVFYAFGIINFNDGIQFNVELFNQFKNSWVGWFVFIAIQTIFTIFLCFIPGVSMALIVLCQTLYDNPWEAFTLSFISVLISSTIMYALGRFGGYKLCTKLLGEDDCKKAATLLNEKGLLFFPVMMLFPFFPDDALVMIAGTLKMSLKWFIPSIIVARGIGIATIVFGISIIPFDKFTSAWHWIAFVAACIIGVVLVFLLAGKLNKAIAKKKEQKNIKQENDDMNE